MKSLDNYDMIPKAMRAYISNNGFHFNKKCCDLAISHMKRKNPSTGKLEGIEAMSKDNVDKMLENNGVVLENNKLYDYVFVANMAKADYRKSLPDEQHIAWYVKETIDDPDASDETTFRRWLATMCGNGEPIEWEDIL